MNNPKTFAMIMLLAACDSGTTHWSERKLVAANDTVGGIAFSIDLPKGMRRRLDRDEIRWDIHENDRVILPEIDVSRGRTYKDAADYRTSRNVKATLRDETLPDGFIVTHENTPAKNDYLIHAARGPLECSIRVASWSNNEDTRSKLAAAEQMCLSIKVR